MSVREAAKALIGGLLAGLTALGTALTDERVTGAEWVGVAVAALVVLAGVYRTPNEAPPVHVPGRFDGDGRYDVDDGHVDTVTVIVGVVIVAAGVVLGTLLLRLL
jgi:hypothetical protein